MAQLILTAGASVASAAGRAGIGAFLARTAATTAAAFAAGQADRLIFGPRKRKITGPRLESFQVQASTEGAPILRVFGRARVAGQVIWAANFKETTQETTESSGGKGGRARVKTTTTEYLYSISFAVGLAEGEIDRIGRVWADGKPFDLSKHTVRVYRGTEDQPPDALIEATEGAGATPAFRGLAYIVFEDLALKDFGNRIPQLAFEVEKSLRQNDPAALENAVNAVNLIPGSGEFVYGTTKVSREAGEGVAVSENVHNNSGRTDFLASLDALEAALPNLSAVSLVVSWFGDDLRAGACTLRPGVETAVKTTAPYDWLGGGASRAEAHLISQIDGAAAFGGTPADKGVIEAIAELKARGLKVMIHPFILMDVPPGNGLPDPYGRAEQAAYPWRGRITVGGNDKTAAAASDIAAFFGAAGANDFTPGVDTVSYSGPAEWSFRRMVLHYAHLCAMAGGVDAFLLGSELRGVTTARDSAVSFPAVAALQTLAADVRSVLGPATQISYGADWSEYFGHQPADGTGDVFFHLDPFWADPETGFIGVDAYHPLADWRDGFSHLDALAGASGPHDRTYLMSNVEAGEGFDWFYASSGDRDAQIRTAIADGAYGEPFVFRFKDLRGWWENAHHDRPAGVRNAAPTAWVPQSKPFVFTETGCPAVDKGANQPNVFVDPKSSESALPHFSNGARDDLAQRRYVEALSDYWRDAANNPVSSVYGGTMIDADRLYVWAWDARPYPDFPARADVWGDAANWEKGHWLTGRTGRAPLDLLVTALAAEADFTSIEATRLQGLLTGYVVDRPMSPREMIDPLADVFQFDMVEAGAVIRFQARASEPAAVFAEADLAERNGAAFSLALTQEADLPAAFRLGFLDEEADYAPAVAEARDPGARPSREAGVEIPAVLPAGEAEARVRAILADAWVMRETLSFSLPPSALELEPGDTVDFTAAGLSRRYRLTEIVDAAERRVEAVRVAPSVYEAPSGGLSFKVPAAPSVFAAPIWELFELPLLDANDDPARPWLAAFAEPWPGGVALYRETGTVGAPALSATAPARAVLGRLETALPSAASGRWDRRTVSMRLSFGALASRDPLEVFSGANVFAVESANGGFEVAQFEIATLEADGSWTLGGLLRGQAGTEGEALAGAAIGARFVLLTPAVTQAAFALDLRGISFDWTAGPEDELPGGANFTTKTKTFNARGLMPLAPVHLRAKPEGGSIRLSWIRRTRMGGDSWEGEVPLGEAFERYRVTIYDGAGAALRSFDAAPPFDPDPEGRPNALYATADITADFGPEGPGSNITFGVAQLSDAVGEGAEGKYLVNITL
ncbi:MAG: glycoside hydrolase/phage tail family protein [Parvularculaceae bacterium]